MKDGTLERRDDRDLIRFERRLSHPVERVWTALTDPDEIAAWLAAAELELEEGGSVVLSWQNTDDEGNTAVARGTVSALDPPRLTAASRSLLMAGSSGESCLQIHSPDRANPDAGALAVAQPESLATSWWPGPGSNRRPFTFQANAATS